MDEVKVFEYQGSPVTFSTGKGVMANATQMAKPFGHGKQPNFWLKSNSAKEFIAAVSTSRNLDLADLVVVRNGGDAPGTWMHEDVAMEFARWLSPAFAIWCNDRIKELLTEGVTTVTDEDAMIARAMRVLQERIDRREEENRRLREQAEEDAPKVLFANAVSASRRSILVGELAKILSQNGYQIGQNRLFARLREEGYLQRARGERYNQPTQYAMEMGLFELKKTAINTPDGLTRVTTTTKVTPKGQQYFINHYLKKNNNTKLIDINNE